LPTVPEHCEHSWQTYHVLLDEKVDRKDLIAHLAAAGIFTNYGAQCIPAQTYFLNKYKYDAPKAFPNAYRAFVAGLAIPLYNLLTDNEVNYIVKTVNQYK
jgi:dTDP-4-amino-4,6-dideoxygalactose transaminase